MYLKNYTNLCVTIAHYETNFQTISTLLLGIKASFGSVLVDDDSGALKLLDSNGKVLTTSSGPTATLWESEPTSACDFKLPGTDVTNPGRTSGCPDGLPNKTVDECCQVKD